MSDNIEYFILNNSPKIPNVNMPQYYGKFFGKIEKVKKEEVSFVSGISLKMWNLLKDCMPPITNYGIGHP